ncbi:hypothetical protein LTR37_000376 [Vermiconidia calcicola]|uniref:Uncharacterized protein n=1 Tax=Vermiconidia calcicola TaxID=1690605 RepID=A0ACC3P175_9PEZI|nr:hypothetical protein LTR37_000376 [Vermiconidia calcicola]
MTSKMKSISRFTGMLSRTKSNANAPPPPQASSSSAPPINFDNAPAGSPEANVGRTVALFCESGSMSNGGEEVLHLPAIVDAAESSPNAAAAAAQQIRKFLGRDYAKQPHVQYNSIMLIRILSDNPGPSFSRNFDKAFVSTVKELLRNCKDGATQQILRETLDNLEANKQYQEGMEMMIQMWRKEKGHQARLSQGHANRGLPPQNDYAYAQPMNGAQHQGQYQYQQQQQQQQQYPRRQLPPPQELASRIEEARNTAKILLQLIQSTPSEELLNNDLLREFADRCQSAQTSMQGYISCDSPPPDDDTMLTLIETNEQLSLASTRYQRALLNARKALGLSPTPSANTGANAANGPYAPPPQMPVPTQSESLFARPASPPRQTYDQGHSAFADRDVAHAQTPPGPPPRNRNDQSLSAFAQAQQDRNYTSPPGPPPNMLARLNSREGQQSPPRSPPTNQQPRLPAQDRPNDPFADPDEHDRNAARSSYPAPNYGTQQNAHPARRPHSHTFSVDAGPQYADSQDPRDYSGPSASDRARAGSGVSPVQQQGGFATQRPYHNNGNTASYIGRQDDATYGTTMHGAQDSTVSEIDGHSGVGRTPTDTSSAYSVSPVEARHPGRGGR